jgi:hypothetical protein
MLHNLRVREVPPDGGHETARRSCATTSITRPGSGRPWTSAESRPASPVGPTRCKPLDRITYWWHGVLVLAVVKAAYPHGPERTEIHLLVARAVRDANPEHASEPLYGLVHTFNNDDLFWRVHPREHPEWQ